MAEKAIGSVTVSNKCYFFFFLTYVSRLLARNVSRQNPTQSSRMIFLKPLIKFDKETLFFLVWIEAAARSLLYMHFVR